MSKLKIKVNDKNIPLTEFPENFIQNTLFGILKSLKGVDEIDNFEISYTK